MEGYVLFFYFFTQTHTDIILIAFKNQVLIKCVSYKKWIQVYSIPAINPMQIIPVTATRAREFSTGK